MRHIESPAAPAATNAICDSRPRRRSSLHRCNTNTDGACAAGSLPAWCGVALKFGSYALLVTSGATGAALEQPAQGRAPGGNTPGDGPRACAHQAVLGQWVARTDHDPSWRMFSPGCRANDGIATLQARNLSLLSLGDSVDENLLKDVCQHADHTHGPASLSIAQYAPLPDDGQMVVGPWDKSYTCRMAHGGLLHHDFILGLSRHGVFHRAAEHSRRSASLRLKHAAERFRTLWDRPPDVIVFSCNFWDVFRMKSDSLGITDVAEVDTWQEDLFDFLGQIDTTFSETGTKIYHTSSYTNARDLPQAAIHDLNAAALSTVASLPHWLSVDLAEMTDSFANRSDYLKDFLHSKPFVMRTLFDIYVSLAGDVPNFNQTAESGDMAP